MTNPFHLVDSQQAAAHEYRVYEPDTKGDWIATVAREYRGLRTATAVPLSSITVEGIDALSVDAIKKHLARTMIPHPRNDNFDVLRSDFGETIAYMILETSDKTEIGYKGIRDRETIDQPDRGIDIVGIEGALEVGSVLTLLIGEVKVSGDRSCPPAVVDSAQDSLRNQHKHHLKKRAETARKIFNKARQVTDADVQQKLMLAAYILENDKLEHLRVVACCVLVRPSAISNPADCGTFRNSPGDYAPADIRFLTVRIPGDVDSTVTLLRDELGKEAA